MAIDLGLSWLFSGYESWAAWWSTFRLALPPVIHTLCSLLPHYTRVDFCDQEHVAEVIRLWKWSLGSPALGEASFLLWAALWIGPNGKELKHLINRQWETEAYQLWEVNLAVNSSAPVNPWVDCHPRQHLDFDLVRDLELEPVPDSWLPETVTL